jgi:hypothetical protein
MNSRTPILDELHAVREEFAREHNNDVRRMARTLQEEEAALRRKVVSLPPKRSKPAKKAS